MTPQGPGDGRVLVVADDDEDILTLVRFRLEQADYEVLTARDGEEALRLILERLPDLAILDVRMPKLTGLEVTRRLREHGPTSQMPVMLLSASVQQEDLQRGFEMGANDYLRKPFNAQELVTRVEALIGAGQ